ncbi:MAG: succinate dehydrogenase cytochrome b subunit [Odoribacter sp.]|nr:succinate dehydrogenase cytochrome b subunit [Odoribacter sp.]
MWLTSSSIGRKFVMAITGLALVLFVTFHVLMNAVALIWPAAYNQVCEFLGANWYALIASAGLALLFIIHIIYALWLTVQNRAARGNDRYAVTARQPQVEWSSKNMLVLGIVVLAFLVVHLIQFWAKMQWQELRHADLEVLPQLEGVPCSPAMGTLFIQAAFSNVWTPIVYIIGFIALWFHMTHGFWSMFHTIGWDNNIWIKRLKTIGCWWATIVVALFIAQAIVFTVHAHNNYYLENEKLQEQYAEFWNDEAAGLLSDFEHDFNSFVADKQGLSQAQQQEVLGQFFSQEGPAYVQRGQAIINGFKAQCAKVGAPQEMTILTNFVGQLQQQIQVAQMMKAAPAPAAAAPAIESAEPVATPEENPVTNQ